MSNNVLPEKNKSYMMKIDDLGTEGEGIGRINSFTVFVDGALPGEVVEALIVKLKKTYGHGKLLRIIEPSENRVEPVCPVFGKCGGCRLQHMSYSAQLEFKRQRVESCMRRIGGIDCRVENIIGMDDPLHYRNKAQFPAGIAPDGKPVIGFFAARSHRVIPVKNCAIQHPVNAKILAIVENFIHRFSIKPYDEVTHTGLIRHVLTKVGFSTGEIMVCVIVNGTNLPHAAELVSALRAEIPGIAGILLNINRDRTNVVMGRGIEVLWGKEHIVDSIGSLKFEISARSFYQVNPVQTRILYETASDFAALDSGSTVIDAYCGIGTISLFLAKKAKKVYGVEAVPEAVADAKRNAALNGIENAEFICGEAEIVIPALMEASGVKPDVIVVDPPRKGCDERLLRAIIACGVPRLVYVSCDPATLARDAGILAAAGYVVEKVQPVDCFPETVHVECVCLMSKTNQ